MFRRLESLVEPFGTVTQSPPDTFWRFLIYQLQPFRNVLKIAAFLSLSVALVETGLIYYAGRLVDMLSEVEVSAFLGAYGLELLLVTLFILIVRPIVTMANMALLNHGLSVNLMDQVRWRSHTHLLGQSVGFFQNDFAGRIANRVMQTGPSIEDSAFMFLEAIWYAFIYLVGASLILVSADIRLVVPILIWFAAYVGLLTYMIPRIGKASQKMSEGRSLVTGRIVDSYTNIQTVKLFAHAGREERFARTALAKHRLRFARLLQNMTIISGSLATLNGVLIIATVGMTIWLWQNGETSIGTVAAATALTLRLNAMTGWIMWVTSQLFQHAGQIKEGMETIAQPHDVVDRENAPDLIVQGGQIRFENIHHTYGETAGTGVSGRALPGGVNGIDLTIEPGQRIGLVGRSGAGKSTLINLLLRFYDVEQGRILIDEQDIAGVTQHSLRQSIAVVTQDTALLHRSIRDNILYGKPDATEEAMEAAAHIVHADAFIPNLRDPKGRRGYDAHVGERGVKLSGGQRQRIALARAVLKDAPLLILDEATSALDSESEAHIQAALQDLMANKTVIAIAHRLSTIQRMDRIIVLDEGRIVEDGTHQELLAAKGHYAGFWERQSGGFIGIDAKAG